MNDFEETYDLYLNNIYGDYIYLSDEDEDKDKDDEEIKNLLSSYKQFLKQKRITVD
jgi:hypothetical protein